MLGDGLEVGNVTMPYGINAIYLTPIFQATSTHRYNTTDYYKIDPMLGTMDDFKALLDCAHRNNLRVVLDGVFNHVGRSFFAFADVLENGDHSPFKDWFHIKKFPLDAHTPGEAQNYLAWWNHKSLPKLNCGNPQVRKYLFDVARYWIDQGIDGWRLDVPNEIDDDGFWEEFRSVVKNANRDAYLLGEIWDLNPRWTDDRHFDGVMNYPVREALLALLQGRENAIQFGERLGNIIKTYPRENLYAMYVPLDSHDTERFITSVGKSLEKTKLAFQVQMGFPGAPAIYYGDEIGLEGASDPDSRRAFPWKEASWNQELRTWVKTLIALRKRSPALRRGDFIQLFAEDGLYAFARTLGTEQVVVVLNGTGRTRHVEVPCASLGWVEGHPVQDLVSHEKLAVGPGGLDLSLPAWSGVWIA